jgi:LPS sulfotransferase NodH
VGEAANRRSIEPCSGAEPREVMPLVSYRANAEVTLRWQRSDQVVHGLHEIHEVAGRRQSAKQVLKVMHLTKRNYLNRVLSIVRAKRTGEWEVKKGKTSERREVYIDPEYCK